MGGRQAESEFLYHQILRAGLLLDGAGDRPVPCDFQPPEPIEKLA